MTDAPAPAAAMPAAAPSAAPQVSPPPAQVEVPVQAPVDQARPLGDQAPPKPEGQESNKQSHISRREALSNAFKRAQEAQEEAAKSPPKRDTSQAPKKDAQAKDAKQPQKAEQQERYREQGKFARDPSKSQSNQQPEQKSVQQNQPPRQIQALHESAPYRIPPNRFSEQSKQEWNTTPESVRGAVYQMAKEFSGAYQKYKADNAVMNDLRPYHDLATKQGTTLRKAFDNYWGIENKLRQDMLGGLDVIVQNISRSQGLTGPHGGPLTFRDVCEHVVRMTPEQHQLTQQRNVQSAAEQRLEQMQKKYDQQEKKLNQILYQQKFSYTRAQVDQFAATHPRFDELADLVKSELDLGFSLEVAYARADRLRPSPHAAQTRTQSAQTRKTSISGAPDGKAGNTRPSDGQRRVNGEAKHPSRREALERAMRRASNGV